MDCSWSILSGGLTLPVVVKILHRKWLSAVAVNGIQIWFEHLSEYVSLWAVGKEEGLPSKVDLNYLHFYLKYTLERWPLAALTRAASLLIKQHQYPLIACRNYFKNRQSLGGREVIGQKLGLQSTWEEHLSLWAKTVFEFEFFTIHLHVTSDTCALLQAMSTSLLILNIQRICEIPWSCLQREWLGMILRCCGEWSWKSWRGRDHVYSGYKNDNFSRTVSYFHKKFLKS